MKRSVLLYFRFFAMLRMTVGYVVIVGVGGGIAATNPTISKYSEDPVISTAGRNLKRLTVHF